MTHLVLFGLMLVYFFSGAHNKVMSHFGFTHRDEGVMWIGVFALEAIFTAFRIIALLVAGSFGALLWPFIWLCICSALVYFHYTRL